MNLAIFYLPGHNNVELLIIPIVDDDITLGIADGCRQRSHPPGDPYHPFGIDHSFTHARIDLADFGNLAILDRNIGIEPGIAAAIDYLAIGDDNVIDAASARTLGGH